MSLRHQPRPSPDEDEVSRSLFPGNGAPLVGASKKQKGNDGWLFYPPGRGDRVMRLIITASAFLSFWTWRRALQQQHSRADVPRVTSSTKSKLALAMQTAPIGLLGPKGTRRRKYRYYDHLFYTALQYGADAHNAIEVGCSSDPFLKYLGWIDGRTCVAPYFIDYGKGGDTNTKLSDKSIEKVAADFMEYAPPNNRTFDLLLCNQVLEHVPNPSAFMKKLIATAKTSIISVPYNWPNCGKICNHVTHQITRDTIMKWSKPHVPVYSATVKEDNVGYRVSRRMILVYKNEGR